ncbi:hypothetical protein RSOL_023400, partial [Rhizoctonia solani AG-3 Rhs1AP]
MARDQEEEAELMHGSVCELEESPALSDGQSPPDSYTQLEGEVRVDHQHLQPPYDANKNLDSNQSTSYCDLAEYEPFAYYWSPGWCQRGMQFLRPIQMSSQFCNALRLALGPTIAFLEAKRLLDKKIARLTDIIQPSLSDNMRTLRAHMLAIKGPSQVAVANGWTSAFPCYGVAINRVTGMHRDQGGFRGGLDVIGVLGTFKNGGDLDLPDLNLRLEWTPGCLGAFDGYDFRHMVHKWSGGSRVTLISFCRKSTWDALKLVPAITRPNISECREELLAANKARDEAVEVDRTNTSGKLPAATQR